MNKQLEFQLNGQDNIELKNLLKVTGLSASGGQAKMAIEMGEVLVDGAQELRKSFKIRAGQTVSYEGTDIKIVP
ncbi:MAG: RNA-binding S4 domain-containing protein [Bdellovibrionales bacterium]|nr:RNA-binding S4 domain-containing protein [Bdellovibrionales bacterium]